MFLHVVIQLAVIINLARLKDESRLYESFLESVVEMARW